jgi:hypothetical protein
MKTSSVRICIVTYLKVCSGCQYGRPFVTSVENMESGSVFSIPTAAIPSVAVLSK